MDSGLDAAALERYARHVVLDEVGAEGQRALLDGSVLVVGAGGLGAPAIQYLAAAGVGTLGIADDDQVERSNLQRQVIHGEDDVGRPKTASAAAFVANLNPDVAVERHDRVTADTANEVVEGYDIVLDATDRFDARYALNAAAVATETPLVYGAVDRTNGQVATLVADDAPCYRCLFPNAAGDDTAASGRGDESGKEGTADDAVGSGPCATRGVLGVLPGLIGTVQATEAIKLLLGRGTPLVGRLLLYDAFDLSFETVAVSPTPDCPVCGTTQQTAPGATD